jgi:predicted RNase H-related nuclease YkuK (DUF458 family)
MSYFQNSEWKIMGEFKKVDLIPFIENFVKQYPFNDIIVGTDSQNHGGKTVYITAIVLVYPDNKGSRVLFTKSELPRIRGVFERLSLEATYSLDVAQELIKHDILVTHIELDFQEELNTKSKSAFKAYAGWLENIGVEVIGKIEQEKDDYVPQLAIAAANKLTK